MLVLEADPSLDGAASAVAALLNEHLEMVELAVGDGGSVLIAFGGEWPTDGTVPLGWTSPDRMTILLNPDHLYADDEAVRREIIAHELAHLLFELGDSNDGTLTDPSLDARIVIGESDIAALAAVSCSDLP